jgi:hypothetical protein
MSKASSRRPVILGKIYTNRPHCYMGQEEQSTRGNSYSHSGIDVHLEGRGCGRGITCEIAGRFNYLHLLGDIVSLISTAHCFKISSSKTYRDRYAGCSHASSISDDAALAATLAFGLLPR